MSFYTGQFDDDYPNGKGKQKNYDGTVFEGDFKRGSYKGQGTMTYPPKSYMPDMPSIKLEGKWKGVEPKGIFKIERVGETGFRKHRQVEFVLGPLVDDEGQEVEQEEEQYNEDSDECGGGGGGCWYRRYIFVSRWIK